MGEYADEQIEYLQRRMGIYGRDINNYRPKYVWKTRSGETMTPENMETSHIENILKCKTLSCGTLPREWKRVLLGELELRKLGE